MPNAPLTIAVLAGLEASGSVPPLSAAEVKALTDRLRDKARESAALSKYDLGEKLLGMLGDSLKKPVAEILNELWKQRKEMRDVAAKTGKEKDVIGTVELYDHSLTWALHPSVKVVLNGVAIHTMKFDVRVKLILEAVQLVLRNACVTGVETGTLKCVTTLEYQGANLMPPIERKVKLPGHLDIPRGGICLN